MKVSLVVPALALVLHPVLACSSNVGAPAPVATTEPATPTPEPTTPATAPTTPLPAYAPITFPQAKSAGGPVIKTPKVLPIFFKGDPLQEQISDFHAKFAASKFWGDVATEYGIGAISPLPPVVLDEAPAAALSQQDIDTWLQTKLQSGALGTPDVNTMYIIYYPASVTVSQPSGSVSCTNFGGYHIETIGGAPSVGYGVIPRCKGAPGQTDLQLLTTSVSHEVFEWATDPFFSTNPAYSGMDLASKAWEFAFLGELGDLCTFVDTAPSFALIDMGYSVQRMWSNKLAAAGHNPCAPASASSLSYFVGVPMVSDPITIQGKKATGIAVKVGEPKDIAIQFYSDRPSDAPWEVYIYDSAQWYGASYSNGSLKYALHQAGGASSVNFASGKNGDVTTFTVTSAKADKALIHIFAARGTESHVWPAMVVAK